MFAPCNSPKSFVLSGAEELLVTGATVADGGGPGGGGADISNDGAGGAAGGVVGGLIDLDEAEEDGGEGVGEGLMTIVGTTKFESFLFKKAVKLFLKRSPFAIIAAYISENCLV